MLSEPNITMEQTSDQTSTEDPYVGSRSFEERDQRIFFGRNREADDLLSLLFAHRCVLLYAQSGAGKTSLVNAGLIQRGFLQDGNEKTARVVLVGPDAAGTPKRRVKLVAVPIGQTG